MYLQLNTRFNPFTYDEMVKPLLYYKQAYDATEAAYSDLATRAEQWKAIAESDDSPMVKAMYQNYSNDLSSIVSDFSRGMTASNRSALLDMRRRYSREIQPIEIAFKRRAQLDDEQRKAMASDPTMLYQRRANQMSLDDFIKNPSLDYGQSYSGAMLTKQVAQAASSMAKEARDSAEGRRKLRALLPYQYELIQQNGFSRDAVMKAIMNSSDADRILTGLVDNAIASSGVLDWGDKETRDRAYDYARQGLWSAIGDTKSQIVTDSYNMQRQLAIDKSIPKGTSGASNKVSAMGLTGTENPFFSSLDNEKLRKRAKDLVSRQSDSDHAKGVQFMLDNVDLNVSRGTIDKRTAEEIKSRLAFDSGFGGGENKRISDSKLLLEDLGYSSEQIDRMSVDDINTIIAEVANNQDDTSGRRIYDYQLSSESFKLLRDNWVSRSESAKFKRVTGHTKNGYSYGKEKKIDDLYEKGMNPVISVDPQEGELTIKINGERYLIPKDIIGLGNYEIIKKNNKRYREALNLLEDARHVDRPLTEEEQNMVRNAQETIIDYNSNLDRIAKSLGRNIGTKNIGE